MTICSKRSTDGGQTWSELWDAGVSGQPGPLAPLEDGRIFMTQVGRTGEPINLARLSADGGKTFPEETNLVVHQRSPSGRWLKTRLHAKAWDEMAFLLGQPEAKPLPGGKFLVVYYSGDKPDHTNVEWTRI